MLFQTGPIQFRVRANSVLGFKLNEAEFQAIYTIET